MQIATMIVSFLMIISAAFINISEGNPFTRPLRPSMNDLPEDYPEAQDFLDRLQFLLSSQSEPSKRAWDLGIGRGATGSARLRQMMGHSAALNPSGPGRRRRSEQA